MSKKLLVFALVICSTVLAMNFASAADAFVFTDVSDARLLVIDNAGNTNATGWLAENGVILSDTYCALGGCTYTGNIETAADINITAGAGGYFIGDGSLLTNTGSNASWTQVLADTLYTNEAYVISVNATMKTYVDAQDVIYNDSIATYVDEQVAGIGGMDYTNVAMINISNTFTPQQTFTDGLVSNGNLTLADSKFIEWAGGGRISANAGVITYKAGV